MELNVRRALENVGYAFVQEEPRLLALRNHRPDFLGWAPNAYGDLVPWVVVEVKHGARKPPEFFLPQLARYRDLLGTVEHYLVLDDAWFRADDGLRFIEAVEGPGAPRFGSTGLLADAGLAESLLIAAYRRHSKNPEGRGHFDPVAVADVLQTAKDRGVELAPGEYIQAARSTLFEASRRFVASELQRSWDKGMYSLNPMLAKAMVSLLGAKLAGTIADPFAGFGTLLWAVAEEAIDSGATVALRGREYDASLRAVAESIAQASPVQATFDSCEDLLEPTEQANAIVSVLPFGVRVRGETESRTLLNGERVRDGDVALVDLALRSLKPGGRAVLLVPAGFTFRASGEAYRRFLAEKYRVAALLGLEGAMEPYSSTRAVLLVIDNVAPGETFVAQLVGGWVSQLAPGGAALEAALAHLDPAPGA